MKFTTQNARSPPSSVSSFVFSACLTLTFIAHLVIFVVCGATLFEKTGSVYETVPMILSIVVLVTLSIRSMVRLCRRHRSTVVCDAEAAVQTCSSNVTLTDCERPCTAIVDATYCDRFSRRRLVLLCFFVILSVVGLVITVLLSLRAFPRDGHTLYTDMGYLPYGTQVANGVIAAAYFSLVMPILGVIACLLKSRRPTLDAVVEKSQVLRSFSPSSSVDTLVTPSSSTDFPRKSLDQLRKSVEMFVPLPLWNTRPEVSVIAVNVTTHVDEHRD